MKVIVGCCGFPVSHGKYYREFRTIELQSTFYQLPQEITAMRWRQEAPSDFEFCMKAWQAITHPLTSPTWRKVKSPPSRARDKYGLLRPTKQNFEAWEATLGICRLLNAKICVIQCPPKFSCTTKNKQNMVKFLDNVDRDRLVLAWEPRGDWIDRPAEIERLCRKLDLVHCVDLLRRKPAQFSAIGYFRLHGLGKRDLNYSYRYSLRDLERLRQRLNEIKHEANRKRVTAYVMFNNVSMFDDAKRFASMARELSK
jgi:uncharacterized protein YecE (DUF72 family)